MRPKALLLRMLRIRLLLPQAVCCCLPGSATHTHTHRPAEPHNHPRITPAADNLLTGSLADYTRADGGPLASVVFNVSRNLLSDSPLPASWHSSTLKVMDVSYNRVPGSLPAQWAQPVAGQRSAFPQLHTLMVQGNALEGTYPYGNGSAFASNFSITARPGNGMLEGAPAPTAAAGSTTSGSSGLSAGAIAGIVVGCVAAAGVWPGALRMAATNWIEMRDGVPACCELAAECK